MCRSETASPAAATTRAAPGIGLRLDGFCTAAQTCGITLIFAAASKPKALKLHRNICMVGLPNQIIAALHAAAGRWNQSLDFPRKNFSLARKINSLW
jgi:hypothetical protein